MPDGLSKYHRSTHAPAVEPELDRIRESTYTLAPGSAATQCQDRRSSGDGGSVPTCRRLTIKPHNKSVASTPLVTRGIRVPNDISGLAYGSLPLPHAIDHTGAAKRQVFPLSPGRSPDEPAFLQEPQWPQRDCRLGTLMPHDISCSGRTHCRAPITEPGSRGVGQRSDFDEDLISFFSIAIDIPEPSFRVTRGAKPLGDAPGARSPARRRVRAFRART
jgi:hypothetical protein